MSWKGFVAQLQQADAPGLIRIIFAAGFKEWEVRFALLADGAGVDVAPFDASATRGSIADVVPCRVVHLN